MSKRIGLTAALWLFFAALPAAALQPLEVFVAGAAKHNPDALESEANLDLQRAQSDVALGRVLPGVTARGTWTRNQYESAVDLPTCATPPCPPPSTAHVVLVPNNQWDGSATLTVPLIDAAGFVRAAAANTAAHAADDQLAATRLQVQAVVAQDYYQLVANMALVAASQKALDVSKESLRLARNRVEAGVAAPLDLDRARADVEQQSQQLSSAQLQVALAARALESASGVAPDAASAPPLDDDLHPESPLEQFESGVDKLPSVVAAAETTRAAEQQANAQRFTLLPVISGTFTERGTSAPGFTGHNWTWQAVLGFTWALDFTTPANMHVQDANASVASARELRVRLAARDAIHRQWETVVASIARSRSARAGRAAANSAADSARDRYQAGNITQLDLLQAQRDAFSAEVSRIQADADLVNARAQLRLATGTSLLKQNGSLQ